MATPFTGAGSAAAGAGAVASGNYATLIGANANAAADNAVAVGARPAATYEGAPSLHGLRERLLRPTADAQIVGLGRDRCVSHSGTSCFTLDCPGAVAKGITSIKG